MFCVIGKSLDQGLSDCLKIVSIFEAPGLSCVCCAERIKCNLSTITHWSSLVAWPCWAPCHHLILLRWGMSKIYLDVHLYIILSKNRINCSIIEMTILPRSQTEASPSTQDVTLYPFIDCYIILQNSSFLAIWLCLDICHHLFLLINDEHSVMYWQFTMTVKPVELFIPCQCEMKGIN